MRMCRVPAVIIAAVIGGAGLTACAAGGSTPAAAGSAPASGGSPAASSAAPASSPASPAQSHSAKPSVTAMASVQPTSASHASTPPRALSSPAGASSGTHSFTVPAVPGDNIVTATGTYTKIGTARVKVTVCAKQTGAAFSVGAEAVVYEASGASTNLGAVILTGPGNSSCVSNTFVFYTAHLKVHAFIGGSSGTIVKTGPVESIY
jgi:poly[(R)-3-hydroxyalkanoate] polymerase subunit PhaC